jgi:DNA-binding CsgD family transcriptional regulator
VTPSVVGRERELSEVSRFLDSIATRFGALLLSGPAGIGKTTLWEHAVAMARERGYRVVVSRPTEVETGLAFAALNDLFGDLADGASSDLPEPQRIALDAALLRVTTALPPQPLAVSIGVRHLVRETAAREPLVIAVDDLPWLDEPSARVLDFVVRRLDDEAVGLIAGQRTTGNGTPVPVLDGVGPGRLTRLDLRGLSIDDVDHLLRDRIGLELARPALVRLHAVAAGNPFYALELGRAMASAGRTDDTDGLRVPPSLDRLVGRRLDALGPDADLVTLYAAAASHPSAASLAAAIGADRARPGLAEAERQGVLVMDADQVRFAHPLLAAAVYDRAPADRRREVHGRLAQVVTDQEERARHLARATTKPDAKVAAELEAAAETVVGRGAPDAAATLADRAADLTPDADRDARHRRRSMAAQQYIVAGDIGRARAVLERLIDDVEGPVERAAALAQMAHLLLVQAEWDQADVMYREAASLVDDDPAHRIPIELGLAGVAYVTWRAARAGAAHAAEALRLAEMLGDTVVLFQTLGHAASWRGLLGQDWRELMERADALAPIRADIPAVEHPDLQFARLLLDAGELGEALERIERLIAYAAERGDWHGLPRLLLAKAAIEARAGDLERAGATLEEAKTGVYQTGEGAWLDDINVLAHRIAGLRGDVEDARATEAAVHARVDLNPALAEELWLTSLSAAELDYVLGDLVAATRHIEPLLARADADPLKPASACALIVLGIEILVAGGRLDEASALAGTWIGRLASTDVGWIHAEADRAVAVLRAAEGQVDEALAASDRAMREAGEAGIPIVLARASLTAGEVRRRARQKARAREALETAVRIFTGLGARPWADRARSELARVASRRPAGAPLTATERRIVGLVAAGRSNREIADALFMSVHTVEAHLTRLFRAFEVQSRTELARLTIEGTDPRLSGVWPEAGT